MKTLLNLLSNLLKAGANGANVFFSLLIALSIPTVLIIALSGLWTGFNDLIAWAITVLMVLFAIAVSLPDEEEDVR